MLALGFATGGGAISAIGGGLNLAGQIKNHSDAKKARDAKSMEVAGALKYAKLENVDKIEVNRFVILEIGKFSSSSVGNTEDVNRIKMIAETAYGQLCGNNTITTGRDCAMKAADSGYWILDTNSFNIIYNGLNTIIKSFEEQEKTSGEKAQASEILRVAKEEYRDGLTDDLLTIIATSFIESIEGQFSAYTKDPSTDDIHIILSRTLENFKRLRSSISASVSAAVKEKYGDGADSGAGGKAGGATI
ncbi:MAG: hypothetical protein LBH41_00365, partial [Rickettsiales bacterium]|nr:hypothetical protein [Rickettsiales bacterium]